jgi:hypothetical protein
MEEIDELTYRDLPYPGYEGLYQMNGFGVRSLDRIADVLSRSRKPIKKFFKGRILTMIYVNGYPCVGISKNGRTKRFLFHRIKADLYIPKVEGKNYINHINGIKSDFSLSNLERCTASENNQHAYDTGLKFVPKGAENKTSKPVVQLTKQGEFVALFGSAREAMRATGVDARNIADVIRGKSKSAKGFVWKFP